MTLPTHKEIEQLYEKYEMYDNIKKHSRAVAKIAVFVTKQLIAKGVQLPLEEIECGALLHDIAKTKCLKNEEKGVHNKIGSKILEAEGYPELAKYSYFHSSDIILEKNGVEKWHALPLKYKILILSDSHVLNFTIVTIEERFDYLYVRYPYHKTRFDLTFGAIKQLKLDLQKKYDLDVEFTTLNTEENFAKD